MQLDLIEHHQRSGTVNKRLEADVLEGHGQYGHFLLQLLIQMAAKNTLSLISEN